MEGGQSKPTFVRPPYVKRTSEEKRLYREKTNQDRVSKGLDPLPAKKKSKPKPKVTHQYTAESDASWLFTLEKGLLDMSKQSLAVSLSLQKWIEMTTKRYNEQQHLTKHQEHDLDGVEYGRAAVAFLQSKRLGPKPASQKTRERALKSFEYDNSERGKQKVIEDSRKMYRDPYGPWKLEGEERKQYGEGKQHDAHVRKEQRKLDHEKKVNEQHATKLQREEANRDRERKEKQEWELMTDSQKEAVIEGRHAKHIAKLQLKHGANWEQVLKDENEKRAARYDQEDGDGIAEGQLADHENEQYDKEQGATPPAPYEPGQYPMPRNRAAAMRDAMNRVDETETPLPPEGGTQAQNRGVPSEYAIN